MLYTLYSDSVCSFLAAVIDIGRGVFCVVRRTTSLESYLFDGKSQLWFFAKFIRFLFILWSNRRATDWIWSHILDRFSVNCLYWILERWSCLLEECSSLFTRVYENINKKNNLLASEWNWKRFISIRGDEFGHQSKSHITTFYALFNFYCKLKSKKATENRLDTTQHIKCDIINDQFQYCHREGRLIIIMLGALYA